MAGKLKLELGCAGIVAALVAIVGLLLLSGGGPALGAMVGFALAGLVSLYLTDVARTEKDPAEKANPQLVLPRLPGDPSHFTFWRRVWIGLTETIAVAAFATAAGATGVLLAQAALNFWQGIDASVVADIEYRLAVLSEQISGLTSLAVAWIAIILLASFAIAMFLCAIGLAYLPGQDMDRAFMVMGYLFCLTAAFVLSKFIRDNQREKSDTPMWRFVVYGAFFMAMTLTAWGLWRMNINETYKVFLLVSWLYLITTTFTLAKTLRDAHDADMNEARLTSRRNANTNDNAA